MESNEKSIQSKMKNQIKEKGKNCGTITYGVENETGR